MPLNSKEPDQIAQLCAILCSRTEKNPDQIVQVSVNILYP